MEDLLQKFFYGTEKKLKQTQNYKLVLKLLEKIRDGNIGEKDSEKLARELGVSEAMYYYLLKKLKNLRMVEKIDEVYRLSQIFGVRHDDLATIWFKFIGKERDVVMR